MLRTSWILASLVALAFAPAASAQTAADTASSIVMAPAVMLPKPKAPSVVPVMKSAHPVENIKTIEGAVIQHGGGGAEDGSGFPTKPGARRLAPIDTPPEGFGGSPIGFGKRNNQP